jgi:hypothetical protein
VQDFTGQQTHYATTHDKANKVMHLTGKGGHQGDVTIDVARQADGRLTLQGRDRRRALTVTLKQRPWQAMRLNQPSFHWIYVEPSGR